MAAGHFHAVTFYETAGTLCRIVGEFLSEGLSAHQPAVVIATPEHRAGILAELRARQVDVDARRTAGDLSLLDAAETLDTFMVGSLPDRALFNAAAARLIEQISGSHPGCTIHLYGEMVDVLWKRGQPAAAIRLEGLWNTVADTHPFSLICGYATGNAYKGADRARIHNQHTHVVILQSAPLPAYRATAI